MPNTAKQEAIRMAYNNILQNISTKYKKQITSNINEDGWCRMFDEDDNLLSPSFISLGFKRDFVEKALDTKSIGNECKWRPKSLQGIENNNGWIRIESEEDLPKDSFNYYAFCSNGSIMTFNDFEYYKKYIIPELKVTHYQPIVKPEKPIY